MNFASRRKLWEMVQPIGKWFRSIVHRAWRILPRRLQPRRVLFLDDDPRRAEKFLAEIPQAVWVETAAACVDRLKETWDEVHLDHDLGGRQHVGVDEVDCGMEVIRWLCSEPRNHLRQTEFFVHTHNLVAGLLMVMQMRSSGFKAEMRPFGQDLAHLLAHNEPKAEGGAAAAPSQVAPRGWLYWPRFLRWPARRRRRTLFRAGASPAGPAVVHARPENCQ